MIAFSTVHTDIFSITLSMPENFYLFLTVSLLINISPGPDMLYTAARSLSQGIKAGIYSALGIFCGCFFHIAAAVFGLSAIIANSVFWFSVIKYAGAGYLVYLGIKSIINNKKRDPGVNPLMPVSYYKIFQEGFLTNLLNPKVAIFFLSFLPQFIDTSSTHIKEQIIFLGIWFAVQGTIILMFVAVLTGYFRQLLSGNKLFWKWQARVTGMILIGLGVKIFISRK